MFSKVGQLIKQYDLYLLLFAWFSLNLLVASFTELYSDEAYYWMYSRFLDWGYYDHPPMVALLIKLGTLISSSELALRLPFIIMSTASVGLIYSMARPVPVHLFFASVFSIFSLNFLGFLSTPDMPLVFFGTLFLYFYRSYLRKSSYLAAIQIGVVAAALLYSKYNGLLIIGLTILSNPKLFTQRTFYVAMFTALLLLLPHVWWQVQHDYSSFNFHLVNRSRVVYNFYQTRDYILGNIPFHGPWVSLILSWAVVRYQPKDAWERALKWNLIGLFLLFLLLTLKRFVEPNWTIFMLVPMLIIGLKQLTHWKKFLPLYLKGCYFFAGILLLLRFHLIYPVVEIAGDRVWEFHGGEAFASTVFNNSPKVPVVANKYQDASILSYYSPDKSVMVPAININSRVNQFDFWKMDTTLCGKNVNYVNSHLPTGLKILGRKKSDKRITPIKGFIPVSNFFLELEPATRSELPVKIIYKGPCANISFDDIYFKVSYMDEGKKTLLLSKEISEKISMNDERVIFPLTVELNKQINPKNLIFSIYFPELGGSFRLFPINID